MPFGAQVILGMALGILLGFLARSLGDAVAPGPLAETLRMGRTAVNVAGQVLVPLIVAKRNALLEGESIAPAVRVQGACLVTRLQPNPASLRCPSL